MQTLVFQAMGLRPDLLSGSNADAENGYIIRLKDILNAPSSNEQRLDADLDAVMKDRADHQSYFAGMPPTFSLSLTNINSIYASITPNFEGEIDSWLSGIPSSTERAVLFSLAYNNLLGASSSLKQDIQNGDRASAWYEIRYNSNGGASAGPGIAKRRYMESEAFGLYDEVDPADVTLDEAKNIFAMYTEHELALKDYDALYGNQVANANSDYNLGSSGLPTVLPRTDEFAPARQKLIDTYAPSQTFDEVFVGPLVSSAGYPWTHSGNDLIIGVDGVANTLFGDGGNDVIVAGSGDSTLDGGDGRDTLNGGSDTNTFLGGAGNDTLHAGSGVTTNGSFAFLLKGMEGVKRRGEFSERGWHGRPFRACTATGRARTHRQRRGSVLHFFPG